MLKMQLTKMTWTTKHDTQNCMEKKYPENDEKIGELKIVGDSGQYSCF